MNDIRKVLSYNDILICPRNSELNHISDADIRMSYDYIPVPFQAMPVINAPMNTVCSAPLLQCLAEMGMATTIHRWFPNAKEQLEFLDSCLTGNHFLSVGIVGKWQDWIDELLASPKPFGILVDVANGDTKSCVDTVKYIRARSDARNIMAGNVATRSGFGRLQDAGANFIRVGIGGGSICSTRTQTGFGMPTLTSIFDCAKVKDSAYLVADGGIETNGDICKAMAAGADMVMAGKLFASTSLAGNEKFDAEGNSTTNLDEAKYCNYHGMASKKAIDSLNSKKSSISVEGVAGLIPYQGLTEDVIKGMIGNLQSAVAYYAGCRNWKEFQRKVKIVEITQQGYEESKTRVVNL